MLESKNVELIDNIEDVPLLSDFDDKNKDKPKLIVFDDFINLPKKSQMKPINDFLISGRKFGFTVLAHVTGLCICTKSNST
jgi:hypothetical protein